MFYRYIALLIAFAITAGSVAADPIEVHAVGVYEGNIRTNGQIHGGQVRVQIDRTEAPVVLAVGAYEPVRWYLDVSPGTRIETIYLHGHGAAKSEVYRNDVPVAPIVLEDLDAGYKNKGERFRALVARMSDLARVDGLSSFHGEYRATETPFIIDAVQTTPDNRVDHLQERLMPERVPSDLRAFLDPDYEIQGPRAQFTYDGFVVTDGDNERTIPVTLDVPDISHPTGATIDSTGGRIFGATLGGEGFLYQYDLSAERWSVLSSMNNLDAAGMIYDAEQDRLVLGLGLFNAGLVIYDLKSARFSEVPIDTDTLPGLTDLFDPGNGPSAELIPVALSGDQVIVRAMERHAAHRFLDGRPPSRTYLINLVTGTATLVAYDDGSASQP